MYRQYPFSEQKQWEAKGKVKETDPTCRQILLFPVTHFQQNLFQFPPWCLFQQYLPQAMQVTL